MNKQDFYLDNGHPFNGIFKEIPPNGVSKIKGRIPPPVYTILPEDNELPSAHKIFMESMNEYDAAMKLVPSWEYWKNMLRTSVRIAKLIDEWREEKLLKDQAAARQMLWDQAKKGNVSAQRILYESKKEEAAQKRQQKEIRNREIKEQEILEERLATITNLKVVK